MRISVITATYNAADYLPNHIQSLLVQTNKDFEWVIADRNSTDDTSDILAEVKDLNLIVSSQPDFGIYDALNRAIMLTTSEYYLVMGADDVSFPGTLNFDAAYFRDNSTVDLIYGHRWIVNDTKYVTGHMIIPWHSNFLMRRWDLIPQESCFWRRSLFERAGNVDPSFRFAMDYDLFVRYMDAGKFQRINRFLAAFRVHQHAKTSTQMSTIGRQEVERVHEKYSIWLIP